MPRQSEARDRRHARWLARLDEDLQDDIAEAGQTGSLASEIGMLRTVLVRAMAEIDDPIKLAETISRLVSATRAAILAERVVSGDKAADLTDALTKVLAELGLSE